MYSLGFRILTSVSFTAILAVCASCAKMIDADLAASTRGGATAADGGAVAADAGSFDSAGDWVLASASTGECVFSRVAAGVTVPGALPVDTCHPCPAPVPDLAVYDGAACEIPNHPRCTYESTTTQYLDCTINANGSQTFVWSTAP